MNNSAHSTATESRTSYSLAQQGWQLFVDQPATRGSPQSYPWAVTQDQYQPRPTTPGACPLAQRELLPALRRIVRVVGRAGEVEQTNAGCGGENAAGLACGEFEKVRGGAPAWEGAALPRPHIDFFDHLGVHRTPRFGCWKMRNFLAALGLGLAILPGVSVCVCVCVCVGYLLLILQNRQPRRSLTHDRPDRGVTAVLSRTATRDVSSEDLLVCWSYIRQHEGSWRGSSTWSFKLQPLLQKRGAELLLLLWREDSSWVQAVALLSTRCLCFGCGVAQLQHPPPFNCLFILFQQIWKPATEVSISCHAGPDDENQNLMYYLARTRAVSRCGWRFRRSC